MSPHCVKQKKNNNNKKENAFPSLKFTVSFLHSEPSCFQIEFSVSLKDFTCFAHRFIWGKVFENHMSTSSHSNANIYGHSLYTCGLYAPCFVLIPQHGSYRTVALRSFKFEMGDHGPIGMARVESGNTSFISHISFQLLTPVGCTLKLRVFSLSQNFLRLWYMWLTQ